MRCAAAAPPTSSPISASPIARRARGPWECATPPLPCVCSLVPPRREDFDDDEYEEAKAETLDQLKEFEQADEILATCGFLRGPMMMDPMAAAMRMARCYQNDDLEGAKKVYKRRIRWSRGDGGTVLYGLMSWIYVQVGEPDEARRVLLKAKKATGDETFTRNWEHLANQRINSFSNAVLGDAWYSLYLETPPTPKQQRVRGNGRNQRGF